MNKENAHLFLPLVKALAEGKTIQFRYTKEAEWKDLMGTSIGFSNSPECYRVKPEPRRITWVTNRFGNSVRIYLPEDDYGETPKEYLQRLNKDVPEPNQFKLIHFIEEIN